MSYKSSSHSGVKHDEYSYYSKIQQRYTRAQEIQGQVDLHSKLQTRITHISKNEIKNKKILLL